MLKGVSVLLDADGQVKQRWVKTDRDQKAAEEAVIAAAEALCEKMPRAKPVKAPKQTESDLLNCYVITDYHLGMLAWAEETGADWDLGIAEDLLTRWFSAAIAAAPKSDKAVLAQLGDFLHFDSLEAVTPSSGHILDADTRLQKLVRVAIRITRRVVDMLLSKHGSVHIIMAEGNHDLASSVWLRETFSALYEDEPRMSVELSPDPYYCVEHGKTALFFHHGHKRKVANIDTVFAAKFREVFGRTKHAFAHMGHLHSVDVKETNLMLVEQHRTLAAPDAYASRGGWMSGRDAKVITYHSEHGEVGRLTISPGMVS